MTWWWGSRGWARATYPSLMVSTPATSAVAVHLASLLALFFSSVASTAPRWFSIFCRQSTPVSLQTQSPFSVLTSGQQQRPVLPARVHVAEEGSASVKCLAMPAYIAIDMVQQDLKAEHGPQQVPRLHHTQYRVFEGSAERLTTRRTWGRTR